MKLQLEQLNGYVVGARIAGRLGREVSMVTLCSLARAFLFAAAAIFAAGQAAALPQNYLIEFDENAFSFVTADWTGTYTVDGGVLTAFSAQIGPCGALCNYTIMLQAVPDDPDDNDAVSTIISSAPPDGNFHDLSLFDDFYFASSNQWQTTNQFDTVSSRSGFYRTTLLPEPRAAALLGAGAMAFALRWRKRRTANLPPLVARIGV